MRAHKEPRGKKHRPRRHVVDIDPEDPSQQLDDVGGFQVEPINVEVRSTADISEDFDMASAENVQGESEPPDELGEERPIGDTGELYGVRTPHAGDPALSDREDRDAYDGAMRGETWLESLEEHAASMGPAPEEEVVVVDDSDLAHRGHQATERDRPVADKGSGGPGGR